MEAAIRSPNAYYLREVAAGARSAAISIINGDEYIEAEMSDLNLQ